MKTLIAAALAATVLAAPALSFAQQSQQPLTRAEVRAQLVQLEQAGYRPDRSSPYYPEDMQAAEARVAAQQNTAYGASTNGSSQAGNH